MKNPFKLSSGEELVRSYRLFEAKKPTKSNNVSLFVTNKRLIILEEARDFLGFGKKAHEYNVNSVEEIYTNVQKKIDILPSLLLLITSIFFFIIGIEEETMLYIAIPLFIVAVVLGVLAFVKPKSSGLLRIRTKTPTKAVLFEVTSLRQKLLSYGISSYKYMNVRRSKDFAVLQFEIGAIIKEIQEANKKQKNISVILQS